MRRNYRGALLLSWGPEVSLGWSVWKNKGEPSDPLDKKLPSCIKEFVCDGDCSGHGDFVGGEVCDGWSSFNLFSTWKTRLRFQNQENKG